MIPSTRIRLIAVSSALIAWAGFALADDEVTVISTATNAPAKKEQTADSDGSPVVHKSSHKKKPTNTASDPASATVSNAPAAIPNTATPDVVVGPAPRTPLVTPPPTAPSTIIRLPNRTVDVVTPLPPATATVPPVIINTPAVNTGLPVPRYTGIGAPIAGVSTYSPMPTVVPNLTNKRQPYLASATSPTAILPQTSPPANGFTSGSRNYTPDDIKFVNVSHRIKNAYPWKTNIITTMFWIGEGSTPISSTTNLASSWDEDWRANNHGSDSPWNRNGFAAGNHASTLNPFYVALPFNDLAFPDKARRWLPPGWYRRPKDGKQVSACKDRWVEIKNSRGDVCYAQWEDVGPLRYDHAEYVFGPERPIGMGDNHAGLDVSPAVAEYLGIEGKDRALTSWRFVDDEDVRPGAWLKLDEQAVLYTALHQLKNGALPIQKASEPIDDDDANKKKIDASKG